METRPLEGQCALVTGASSGIGAAIAVALGAAGAKVVVNYVESRHEAEAVVSRIEGAGAQAFCLHADVSREAEVHATFRAAIDAFGTIDILVNNAGIQKDAPLHELSLDDVTLTVDGGMTLYPAFRTGG